MLEQSCIAPWFSFKSLGRDARDGLPLGQLEQLCLLAVVAVAGHKRLEKGFVVSRMAFLKNIQVI